MYVTHDWKVIPDFPLYSISNTGLVRNDHTDRIMRQYLNSHGVGTVGFMKNGVQRKRAVAPIVAAAFLKPPKPEQTTPTVINLDGDRLNNHVDNLMWRPLWFARLFHAQFHAPPRIPSEIMDLDSGEVFRDSLDAASKYGLLDRDILLAAMNRIPVWPTFQYFRALRF